MSKRRRAILSTAALVISGCHPAAPVGTAPTAIPTVASSIRAEDLRRDLTVFASDSFRGRETGTPDARRAADFLVRRLQTLGLEPAGDSMYLQHVPLLHQTFGRQTRVVVTQNGSATTLRIGDEVLPVTSFGDGLPEPRRNAEGELVFAGYGSAQELSKVDVTGKVVVVIHGAPPGSSEAAKKVLESQQGLGERLGRLLPLQPAAVVFLMIGGAEDFYWQLTPELTRGVAPLDRREAVSDAARPLPMVVFGVARSGSPLLPPGWPSDARPQSLGRRFSGHVELSHDPFTAYNVVAVVRGTDPRFDHSYVAFGAHYDHIGIVRADARGDTIANGADDDGSGSMALLAIAAAMQRHPPRRSVLFVWHVGEEKGLLGSSYFTEHPTVPIDSIVAQLNADMIGRNAPSLLYIVGPQAAPHGQSRVLGEIVDSVNRALPTPFAFDREWDDVNNPERIYQRSDHYNYAKRGIPIVFFTTGLHDDYHRPSDEPSKIDYEKMARVARLMLETGYAVADRATRPR